MENIKKQFQDILNNSILPMLKSTGFRKKGLNFHTISGEMIGVSISKKLVGVVMKMLLRGILQ